jgi:hypothetical protein
MLGIAVEMKLLEKIIMPPAIKKHKHTTHKTNMAAIIKTILVELFIDTLAILTAAITHYSLIIILPNLATLEKYII